jgi:P-type Ca2+ transporter type 2C
VSTPTGAPPSGPTGAHPSAPTPDADGHAWHALSADLVLQAEHVDAQEGLSSAEVLARTQRFGPNKFDSGKAESRWRAFIRQYADPMQIVLLVAGVGSLYPLKELGTGLLLLLLTVFNAVLGLRQEGKAAAAVPALQQMMIVKAKVRRDSELTEIPADQLVPGDVVAIEAGDIIPADGRLLKAATLEVAESALTGESLPVAKDTDAVDGADTPLGDRTDMVYLNTNLTSSPPCRTGIPPARLTPRSGGFLFHRQPPPQAVVLRRLHRRLTCPPARRPRC